MFAAVLPVLVMLLSSGAWVHYHQIWAKSGWVEVAQAVQANKKQGDVVVAAGPLEAASVVVLPDEFSGLDVINIDVPYYADNTPWGSDSPRASWALGRACSRAMPLPLRGR